MKNSSWALCAAAVLTVNMGLHVIATQPMARSIESLTAQVTSLQSGIDQLTASTDTATQTNDLLASLKIQGDRTQSAREAIEQIRRFEREVRSQGLAAGHSMNLVKNIGRLHEEIVTQGQQIAELNEVLDDLSAFQQQVHGLASAASREYADVDRAMQLVRELGRLKQTVASQAENIDTAVDSLQQLAELTQNVSLEAEGVDQATKSLRQLGDLKERVATETDGLEVAEAQFARLVGLKKSVELIDERQLTAAESKIADLEKLQHLIIKGGRDITSAVNLSSQLLSMQDELIRRGGRIDVARKHADGLLSLESALADDARLNINHAQDNLEALVAIERRLTSQDEQIIAAVESLELMSDLQAEFAKRIEGFESLRSGLMELAMLESSLLRAVRSLEPLIELTNLHRLNGNDLQAVARGMIDRRRARIAANDPEDPTLTDGYRTAGRIETDVTGESLVPIPPTDE